jgi:hypothetical protein
MDDHFDRRRSVNHISDADGAAKQLLDTARSLGGSCVVDYHARGMNADFFPRYGPWLARFTERELPGAATTLTAAEIAQAYLERSRLLAAVSRDETLGDPIQLQPVSPRVTS